jgi:hypothetical protein
MLTDLQCRKAKSAAKPYKMTDGGGLHLFVTPAGGKHWRYRYEFEGREKVLTIGPCPSVGLTDARTVRDGAKSSLREGGDPSVAKRVERAKVSADDSVTFELVAREWHRLTAPHIWTVAASLRRFGLT